VNGNRTRPLAALLVALISVVDITAAEPLAAPKRLTYQEQNDALGVTAWHEAGHKGRGIKVLVLDQEFRNYPAALGNILPERVEARSFRFSGNIQATSGGHGIRCAEIVHTLAPEAELLFADWQTDRPQTFLDAVAWARRRGVRIITCSYGMPTWSDGAGGGVVHDRLRDLVGSGSKDGDLLFFASAGNRARGHWTGAFRPDDDGYHQWEDGNPINEIRTKSQKPIWVYLYGPSGSRYVLQVYDRTTKTAVTRVVSADVGLQVSTVKTSFHALPDHAYELHVWHQAGGTGRFHVAVKNATLSCSKPGASVAFPADGDEVLAIGALNPDRTRHPTSSFGPAGDVAKPNFMTFFRFTYASGDRSFTGTSAASAEAAGLTAALWSRHPDWSAADVRKALRRDALPLKVKGETGAGMLHLPKLKQPAHDK
jgi:subtilisin family serine protease